MKAIPVIIDRSSPVPLYHQLSEQLTAAIADGTLKPGDPFENELALAERLDLSRPTVRRAIAELVTRGLLVRRRGVGTVVASEVKNLANQTARSTADIDRQVADIRAATEAAVAAVGEIGDSITEIDEVASAIAAAMEEQEAVTQALNGDAVPRPRSSARR